MRGLLHYVGEVLGRCEICRASDKAPHVPIAGTSTAAMFNEQVQVDLLFMDEIIALRAMDTVSEYSLFLSVQPETPQEVWEALCGGCLGIFGSPKNARGDEGGLEE